MRIAYVSVDPGIPVFGTKGASVHIQEVVRELRSRGHEVVVLTTHKGIDIPADLADLEVIEVPIGKGPTADREQAQRDASTDITQRVLAGGFDLIYERYSLFSTVIADSALPGILEVNAPLIDEQKTHRELIGEAYALAALRQQVASARATVCVSDPVRAWVQGHCGGNTIHTVPNGVNTSRITPQPAETDPPVVVFVGTLKPWHGVAELIDAAALADETWQLRIIGTGPEQSNLEQLAKRLNVAVDFRGAVAPELMPQHLAGASIGVAPYPAMDTDDDQYFSPLKVYEYMAAGLAVVASSVGQIPTVMEGAGVLVPPSNAKELSRAIDALIANPTLVAQLGVWARRRAEQHHSWTRVVDTILDLAGVNNSG